MTRARLRPAVVMLAGLAAGSVRCASTDGAIAPASGGAGTAAGAGGGATATAGAGGTAGGAGFSPFGSDAFPHSGQAQIVKVPPDPTLSCGPGCRVALNLPTDHVASANRAESSAGIVEVSGVLGGRLMFAAPGDSDTTAFLGDDPGYSFVRLDLFERSIAYVRASSSASSIEVLDVDTGHYRAYGSYANPKDLATWHGPTSTALNATYAFWNMDGIGVFAADRASGEARLLGSDLYECQLMFAIEAGAVCASGGVIWFFDPDPMTAMPVRKLADGPGIRLWATTSPARDKIAFIDYRDTPSVNVADLQFGDVYVLDAKTNALARITHDGPTTNRPKALPSVDGDLAAWFQVPASYVPEGPLDNLPGGLVSAVTTLALRDGAKGRTCLWDQSPLLGWTAIIGRHLYGYMLLTKKQIPYLVELDVDDPAVPWTCTTDAAP